MDCNEVYEKLGLLVDGELPESEKEELLNHIHTCTNCKCKDLYESEYCLKQCLQKFLFPKQVPKWLVDDIRSYVAQVR